MWPRQSKVDNVEDVAEQEDMNANVWMLQASRSDHCKDEPPDQESRTVGILRKLLGSNALVKTFKALPDVILLQGLPPLMQEPEEIDWNDCQDDCKHDS